jgi:nanoRNase/pAp phosphatase (c-di-AMP/oligoRNAs hydrolase)
METYGENIGKMLTRLDQILDGQKKLLVILHNHPDPDALASGFALKYLAEKRYSLQGEIAYGGLISRAENLAMVRELKIPLKRISRVKFTNYDRIAMVDTQPGQGNNSLPPNVDCHILIDHHPVTEDFSIPCLLIDPNIGATATLLTQLLDASGVPFITDLATALTYAIRSETQELGRETHEQDIDAHFLVYRKASMNKLARISLPKLPRTYFAMLAKTLDQTHVFRHLLCTHIGDVPNPETVAEMADLLLRHERISWVLCTGQYKRNLILSMRSSNPEAKAGQVIRQLVPDQNNAGGHDMFAGGKISLDGLPDMDITILELRLSQQFAELMGFPNADWKPLFENTL